MLALVLALLAMVESVPAQDSSGPAPLPSSLNLEYEDPAGRSPVGTARAVAPTPQGVHSRRMRSHAALEQLVNPFDGTVMTGRRHNRGRATPPRAGSASEPIASPQYEGGGWRSTQVPSRFDNSGVQPPRVPFPQASVPAPQMPQAPIVGMPGASAGSETPSGEGGVPLREPTSTPGEAGVPGLPPLPTAETRSGATPGATTSSAAETAAPNPAETPTRSAADLFSAAGEGDSAGFGGTVQAGTTPFAMIGDIVPFSTHAVSGPPGPPPPPGARAASPIFPSVRNLKLSENQSPRPQDRVFFNFNYYNNVNDTINRRDLSPITQMKAYVYNFGIEKTFNNGLGSIGIRVPLDNLTANSYGNIVSTPTSTAPGNLTIFAKYILAQNPRTGSLISALWGITPQTATGRFAGAPYLFPLNSTYFQPAIGYIYNHKNWYVQGFSGFTFPMNPNDVSLIYNDVAVGYFLLRDPNPNRWLQAVAPTFELHVNNPLNHRDPFNRLDLAGSPDSVDLTFGLNFGFRNSVVLTAAYALPVSSPQPFDSEAILMLNIFFGRTRRLVPTAPPPM